MARREGQAGFEKLDAMGGLEPVAEREPTAATGIECRTEVSAEGLATIAAYQDGEDSLAGQIGRIELDGTSGDASLVVDTAQDAHEGAVSLLEAAEYHATSLGLDRLSVAMPTGWAGLDRLRAAVMGRGYEVSPQGDVIKALVHTERTSDTLDARSDSAEEAALDGVVERASAEIRPLPHEVAYAFGRDGEIIWRQEGDASSVSFTDEQVRAAMGAEVMLHNHPRGTSFSGADIATAHVLDAKEMRVAGHFGDVYVLRPPESYTFSSAAKLETSPLSVAALRDEQEGLIPGQTGSRLAEQIEAQHERLLDDEVFGARVDMVSGMSEAEAEREMSHRAMTRLADMYGLQYQRIEAR